MVDEYVEHLSREGSIVSPALQQALGFDEKPADSTHVLLEFNSSVSIEITPETFYADAEFCELSAVAGNETFGTIQKMLGKKCSVRFHNFKENLKIVSYQVNKAHSSQKLITLKFTHS